MEEVVNKDIIVILSCNNKSELTREWVTELTTIHSRKKTRLGSQSVPGSFLNDCSVFAIATKLSLSLSVNFLCKERGAQFLQMRRYRMKK